MGLNIEASSVRELWRIEDELQFRQVNSIGGGKFLLSGGLDCPTWPQSKLSCALALLDVRSRAYSWRTEQKRHKTYDYSCATLTHGIGVIPHEFKSDFCGIIFANLKTGLNDYAAIQIANINGVVPLNGDSFAFVRTLNGASQLWMSTEAGLISTEISSDRNFRIASLVPCSKTSVITVMQDINEINRKCQISFAHQLRNLDGSICWEYRSEKDTSIKMNSDEILLYNNASDQPKTRIDVVSSTNGKLIDLFEISGSIANLISISNNCFVYCNPNYEMCLFDRSKNHVEVIASFPSAIPGWLVFAVDTSHRIILGCKADNFMSPKSTIAVFSYSDS